MNQLFALSLGIAAMAFAAAQAQAQAHPAGTQCAARGEVVKTLASRYGETRQAIGLAAANQLMELYASADGSWTLTVTMTDGMTCLLASGQSFEKVQEPLVQIDPPA